MLIAHRANNNHSYLENTKEAVLECLNTSYIDGIEIDVRMTKDNKIVVIHSMLIDLISNGNGFIKDKTLKELKSYTFKNNQTVATLEEILKIMNDKLLLIEIKEESNNYRIVDVIYKLIKKYSYLNISICSFNYELLNYFKKIDNKINCILIISYLINSDKIHNHLNNNSLKFNRLKNAKEGDYIWTINNILDYKKIKQSNKNLNVITDIAYKLYEI